MWFMCKQTKIRNAKIPKLIKAFQNPSFLHNKILYERNQPIGCFLDALEPE